MLIRLRNRLAPHRLAPHRLADVVDRLDRRALPAVPAARPAVLRIANGIYTSIYLGRRVRLFRRVHRTDPELFQPVGPVTLLPKPLPPRVADSVFFAALATNALATLGVAHRVSGPLHAALTLWTMSYRNSWSMILHDQNNMVLQTAVLGLTPAADAVSVDALVRRRTPGAHWVYSVPVRGMQLVPAVTYFLAGVAKVTSEHGWGWADGEVLRRQIAEDGLRKELLGTPAATLGIKLLGRRNLFTVMAAGSLALELVAPLVLVDRRLARWWAAGAFAMHWGIFLIMGIRFRHNLCGMVYLPFFQMEKAVPPPIRGR